RVLEKSIIPRSIGHKRQSFIGTVWQAPPSVLYYPFNASAACLIVNDEKSPRNPHFIPILTP
ncbi:MAG TPA: hypothetical protein VD994_09730, partial [Prosthecobacter sp.]|nr:hypothetical protein [Prosthecobacter sp.]